MEHNPFADIEIPSEEEIDRLTAPGRPVKKSSDCVKTPGTISEPKVEHEMTMTERYEAHGVNWSVCGLRWNPTEKVKTGLYQKPTHKVRGQNDNATILYCEDAITVIDLDDFTKPEAQQLKGMLEASGCNAIQKTRKGFHYVFKAKPDIYTNTYKDYGFDIRSKGGVIYCEPSSYTHPTGKVEYKWLTFPADGEDFVEMPEDIHAYLVSLGCSEKDKKTKPKPKTPTPPPSPSVEDTEENEFEPIEEDDDDEESLITVCSQPLPRKLTGLEEINRLAKLLTPAWLTSFNNWIKFAYCLKGLADTAEGLELFLHHSARATRYDTAYHIANNRTIWEGLKPKGHITIGSLKHWAKKCDPETYFKESKNDYKSLIRLGTQTAYCELFYNEMAGDIIYSHAHKCFYFYDPVKGLWRECEDDSVINFQFVEITTAVIRKLMGEIPPATTEEEQAKFRAEQKLYLKAQNSCDIRAKQMVKDFLPALCRAEIDPATYFNKDADLLPLENGVWKFSEKRLIPYEREHFFTFRIPIAYNPKADTTDIRKAVNDWFNGDEEVVKFIQFYIGYCLTGHTNRQDFLIAWGNAAGNGKSLVWGEIMKRLLGDPNDTKHNSFWGEITTHAISISAGENNDQLYNIDGKRFVMLSEPQEGQKTKIDTNLLKKLTGDRTHTCSAKYKNAKTFNIVAKFQISCNDIPDMKLDSPAMKRRCLVVEQNVAFRDEDEYALATEEERTTGKVRRKDEAFIKRLLDNAEGLMAWAIEGAKAYVDDPSRQPPDAMMNAKAKAQTNTDALGTWIKGNIRNLKTIAVADRPAGWERKKVSLKELKDMWKTADLFPESRKSGFNTTFCEKARALGYDVDAGRSGKSEEKIKFAELIADEDDGEE